MLSGNFEAKRDSRLEVVFLSMLTKSSYCANLVMLAQRLLEGIDEAAKG